MVDQRENREGAEREGKTRRVEHEEVCIICIFLLKGESVNIYICMYIYFVVFNKFEKGYYYIVLS